MMTEQEIALGALIAAQSAANTAYKQLAEDSFNAVDGSRLKTFAGVSSMEAKEACALIEKASRLFCDAVARMRRYEDIV